MVDMTKIRAYWDVIFYRCMADWFEVLNCLLFCCSYKHGYWWYYDIELL